MPSSTKLYLFDFDGTLTTKDSLFDFLKFICNQTQLGKLKYYIYWLIFLPVFILSKANLYSKSKAKERFISVFLMGKTKDQLNTLAQLYFEYSKDYLLRPNAIDYINKLPKDDSKYIVTASLDIWVKPFAGFLNLTLISTQGKFDNNIYTGKFLTKNCNYNEKVNRINSEIDLSVYTEIIAFGDSSGDSPMFKLATQSYLNYFL